VVGSAAAQPFPVLRAAIEDGANNILLVRLRSGESQSSERAASFVFDRPIVATVLALGFEILAVTGSHAARRSVAASP
jgi:hypothetical protein